MKAISIHTLYATAIAYHDKLVELRSWRTSYRGDILICAAKTDYKNKDFRDYFVFGHAIAVATIVDCCLYDESLRDYCFIDDDYDPTGSYCFILDNIRPIKPIPIKGQQRIYNVDLEVEDLEILNIDVDEHPEELDYYWFENGYVKKLDEWVEEDEDNEENS